jgi:hypothetical protein
MSSLAVKEDTATPRSWSKAEREAIHVTDYNYFPQNEASKTHHSAARVDAGKPMVSHTFELLNRKGICD